MSTPHISSVHLHLCSLICNGIKYISIILRNLFHRTEKRLLQWKSIISLAGMAEVSQDWMEMGELGILRQPWHREQPLWAPQEQGLHTWPLAGDYGYGTVWVSHALLPFLGKGASINSLPASELPTDPLQLWGAAENTEIQNEHPLMCWQQDLPGFCHRNTCAGSPKDVSSLLHSCFPSNTISWPISTFS